MLHVSLDVILCWLAVEVIVWMSRSHCAGRAFTSVMSSAGYLPVNRLMIHCLQGDLILMATF